MSSSTFEGLAILSLLFRERAIARIWQRSPSMHRTPKRRFSPQRMLTGWPRVLSIGQYRLVYKCGVSGW